MYLSHPLHKVFFQRDMTCGDFKCLHEEQFLIKYYVIKHLVLLKIKEMKTIISIDLHQWFINFLTKSPLSLLLTHRHELNLKTNNYKKNYINQLFRKF